MPHCYTRMIIFLGFFVGLSKAHGFVRLVILAALGLAGLWMVHTLAQDYNKIIKGQGGGASSPLATGVGKFFQKRSTDIVQNRVPEINWELVLSRDPARCARSFICQLAAQNESSLDEVGQNMLRLTRLSAGKKSWASVQLQEALKFGEKSTDPQQCMKMYKFCPYSSRTMLSLLRIFGG